MAKPDWIIALESDPNVVEIHDLCGDIGPYHNWDGVYQQRRSKVHGLIDIGYVIQYADGRRVFLNPDGSANPDPVDDKIGSLITSFLKEALDQIDTIGISPKGYGSTIHGKYGRIWVTHHHPDFDFHAFFAHPNIYLYDIWVKGGV